MQGTVANTDICAISTEEQSVQIDGPIGPQKVSYAPAQWFPLLCHDLWRPKAPAAVCDLAGFDHEEDSDRRKARKWTSGFNEVPGWLVVVLLRSKEGFRILNWIMRDDPPDWWLVIEQDRKLAALATEMSARVDLVVKQ